MPETPPKAALPKPKLRWYQFGLRTLLLFALIFAVLCSWVSVELRRFERHRQAYRQLEMDFYTTSASEFPCYISWLHRLLGNEDSHDLGMLVFNNEAAIDDSTLATVAQFENLEQLWLNGDITITDAGLEHLKKLKQLDDLSLADANVTPEAVKELQNALPHCKISWTPPVRSRQ
jgi:hypothetical protein